jgi:cytochrome P450
VANAFDILLDHPDELQAAAAAARAGDDETVLRYVLEALRFHPPAPVMVRLSLSEEPLAKGSPRETVIPGGKLIFAANGSAMMDEVELEHPLSFDLTRPWHHYLHFGWGMHECLGYHLATAQLTELAKALLSLGGLRRAAGADGKLAYAGAFPQAFSVEFDQA